MGPERETPYSTLGKAIRVTRESVGLNQAQLAKKCGVSPAEISRLEKGQRNPTFKKMWRLTDELGVPLSHIVNLQELFARSAQAAEKSSAVLRGLG